MSAPLEFTKGVAVFVEGRDEVNVLASMTKLLGRDDMAAFDVGGKEQFRLKFPPAIKAASFSAVKSIGIIRDADDDENAAFNSVRKVLVDSKLVCPSASGEVVQCQNLRIGVLILPGTGRTGYLEDLFLDAQKQSPLLACVENFALCCESNEAKRFTTKQRAYSLLATFGATEPRLGRAFEAGHVTCDDPAYDVLRDFLLKL